MDEKNLEYNTYSNQGSEYHWKWLEYGKLHHFSYSYYDYIKFIAKKIIFNIKKTNSKTILDAGCGDCVLLSFINKVLPDLKLSGFDIIESALDIGRKKIKNSDLFVYNIRDIFSLEKSYDYIICTEVIDHVKLPQSVKKPEKIRKYQIAIFNRLISMANKGVFLTIPTRGVWRESKFMEKDILIEPLVIQWIKSFNFNINLRIIKNLIKVAERIKFKHYIRRLEKLISFANKIRGILAVPVKDKWISYKKEEEIYLTKWLESLNLKYFWDFLKHDRNHPKGTYYVEIEK